jgi:SAM-dependent methyltransferase
MNTSDKKVLNVGGNRKEIQIPSCFNGWRHDLLDIDPKGNPDILCDAREIWKLPPRQYDAVYCSHNLEHFLWHDVPKVLKGFRLILKKDGFVYIRVPNLLGVMRHVVENNLDLCDQLYVSAGGFPIATIDVVYGFRKQIESSGEDFFCHKTGFSRPVLEGILKDNGFGFVYLRENYLELAAIAFMQKPDPDILVSLGIAPPNKAPDMEKP